MKTRGEIEAAISDGIINSEQDFMDLGLKDIHSYMMDDIVVMRLQGVLTTAEQKIRSRIRDRRSGRKPACGRMMNRSTQDADPQTNR